MAVIYKVEEHCQMNLFSRLESQELRRGRCRRHRFPPAIIQHAVWLYLRFTLSYRDIEDLLAERGLDISYETVRRWVAKFGPLFARELRHRRPRPTAQWHLDEGAPRRREGGAMI